MITTILLNTKKDAVYHKNGEVIYKVSRKALLTLMDAIEDANKENTTPALPMVGWLNNFENDRQVLLEAFKFINKMSREAEGCDWVNLGYWPSFMKAMDDVYMQMKAKDINAIRLKW